MLLGSFARTEVDEAFLITYAATTFSYFYMPSFHILNSVKNNFSNQKIYICAVTLPKSFEHFPN